MDGFNSSVCYGKDKFAAKLSDEPIFLKTEDASKILAGVKVCSFTGHRPEKLGIYEESDEKCIILRFKLRAEIEYAISEGYTTFLTGMARGIDTWAAEAVIEYSLRKNGGVSLYAAVPYPGQEKSWLEWEQERYSEILRFCKGVFLVSDSYSKNCMSKRNEFLVNHSDRLISVYDGKRGGTENTLRVAEKLQKNIRIIVP